MIVEAMHVEAVREGAGPTNTYRTCPGFYEDSVLPMPDLLPSIPPWHWIKAAAWILLAGPPTNHR